MNDARLSRPPGRLYHVARIPYLNVEPFFLGWGRAGGPAPDGWMVTEGPPRALGVAAERGEVDAAVFSEADLHRLRAEFTPLALPGGGPQIGISNRDRVGSVFLFVRAPDRADEPSRPHGSAGRLLSPEEVARLDHARILLTGESATSVRLVQLILAVAHGLRGIKWTRMDFSSMTLAGGSSAAGNLPGPAIPDDAQAALVIGDTALRWGRRPPSGFALGMDLAAAWHGWTGLPFVFARWGVRRSVPEAARASLARTIAASLERAEISFESVARGYAGDLGSAEDLAVYLRGFGYRLGPEELAGASRFHELLDQHGITGAADGDTSAAAPN